ncbi:MAG TPA: serine/threonine-protein kinase [Gemmataceae bacterium]|jgi:tetratricopeptide (TPR) repeat protein|nr:serine/threonine-protein kinase [Gemmataceae bacterium]
MPPPTEGLAPSVSGPGARGLPNQLPAMFGRYRLVKLLGEGGMGAVYLAHDTQLDRPVALKVPFFGPGDGPEIMERFLREARAAATVQHANLCPVYDVGEIDGAKYLTMAFIEGRLLSDVIRAGSKPLPPRQVAGLVRKLALALEEAHRRKVIHRDLKPANIMLTRRGEPVIMDFGLARRGGGKDARLTQAGAIMGTPAYMAPEQARGSLDEMGPGCDVYSLGVILYELLTGRLPFVGDTMAVLAQVLADEPEPPSVHRPDLDLRLQAVCLKAMAKKPGARYRTMGDFAAALTEYLKDTTEPTVAGADAAALDPPVVETARKTPTLRPPRAKTRRPRPRRARKFPVWGWAAIAGGAAALVLLGVIIYVATNKGTIKIELSDPKAQVDIKVDGDTVQLSAVDQTIRLRPGKHGLEVTGKDYRTVSKEFTVVRGDNRVLQVALEPVAPAKAAARDRGESGREDARMALARARDHLRKHEFEQATVEADKALQLDPKLAGAFLARAQAHNGKGERQAAAADATEALRLDPQSGRAYVVRCVARGNSGDVDGAIADATEALRLNPEDAAAYFNRCWLYTQKGDLDRAIGDCDALLRLHPRDGPRYLERGKLYARKGDQARAKADFDKAVELDSGLASRVPALPGPGPAASPVVAGPAWPAEALRQGKIPAPDLRRVRPWFSDKFANSKSGFPVDADEGYQDRAYVVRVAGGRSEARIPLDRAKPPNPAGAFACEVVGRAQGRAARWGLAIADRSDTAVQVTITLANPGVLWMRRAGRNGVQVKQLEPEPGQHPAIKKGARTVNTLLVIVRGRVLEVYVNGAAVCDPILLDWDMRTPQLWLVGGRAAKVGIATFERVTVWPAKDILPVEKRGAVMKGQ